MNSNKETDLYQQLAARHGWPDSKYLPLIFKRVVSPEQARMMLQLTATSEEIADKLGIDRETVDRNMQELLEKGVVFPMKKGWRLGRIIDSLHDLTLSNTKYWESYGGSEYGDLWNAFERLEWWPEFVENIKKAGRPFMRILPAWEAIRENPERVAEEDLREIYKKVQSIVVIPCPCRRERYDRQCSSPDEMCVALDRSAEFNLKRGVGKKLSYEEALELEKEARKHNLFTQVPNSPITNQVICHCHACCCVSSLAFGQFDYLYRGIARSRYQAEVVAPDKCTACQICMEACQFGAIEMRKYPDITRWKAYVNVDKCMGCGNCVVKCPREGTVILNLVRPTEHIPREETDVYAYGQVQK